MSDPFPFDVNPWRPKAELQAARKRLVARVSDCKDGPACPICQRARAEALKTLDEALR